MEDEILLLCEEYGIKEAWYTPMHGTEEQQFFDTLLASLASKAPQLQFRSLYPNMLFTDSELPFAPPRCLKRSAASDA